MIIAAFGIPGSGKSTTTKEIGKILDIETFHEPEEPDWGEAVKMRNICGNFNAIMWFRSVRVPHYYKASELRRIGKVSMLDSCYDKLFYLYHDKPGLEWLFSPQNSFYDEMVSISKKDYLNLPEIDLLILFKQSEKNWRKFLNDRNRDLDNEEEFKRSFILQEAFINAARTYCANSNCILYEHSQSYTDSKTEALKIVNNIKQYL